jgi:transcriptional antiterminator
LKRHRKSLREQRPGAERKWHLECWHKLEKSMRKEKNSLTRSNKEGYWVVHTESNQRTLLFLFIFKTLFFLLVWVKVKNSDAQ